MRPTYAIFAEERTWRIAKVVHRKVTLVSLEIKQVDNFDVSAIGQVMTQLEYAGEDVFLGLPSNWCLSAAVSADGLRPHTREATLRFRLEEQIPLSLEEIVVDFIDQDSQALGVAVLISKIGPVVNGLESAGISVVSICPTALLIAQQVRSEPLDAILCELEDGIDLLQFKEGRIYAWTVLPSELSTIRQHLLHASMAQPGTLRIKCAGTSAEWDDGLSCVPNVERLTRFDATTWELAALAVDGIVTGSAVSPLELHRGPLAVADPFRPIRSPLCAASIALILLGVSLAAAMSWRGAAYERVAQIAHQRQLEAFAKALPGQTPPPLIVSRLQSEQRRLRGVRGLASMLPPSLSILTLLHDTLAGLPHDMRFRLLELRFDPQLIYVEGQTLDHSDAAQIADDLRGSTGLSVDPPHTEQPAGDDVTFIVSASATKASLATDREELNP